MALCFPKVQGILLTQSTASAMNNDIEIVVESPCEGVGWASVLGTRWWVLHRAAPLLGRRVWRAGVLAMLLSLPLMRCLSDGWALMAIVVGASHGLVPIGLDVVLVCLVVFHCGGMITSAIWHVIAKLQLSWIVCSPPLYYSSNITLHQPIHSMLTLIFLPLSHETTL